MPPSLPIVAESLADRIIIIKRGRVLAAGTADELKRNLLGPPLYELRLTGPVAPGVEQAEPAVGTADGTRLLCVGALAPHKGQDVLLDALVTLIDLDWQCLLVGAEDRDRPYVEQLRRRVAVELRGRVTLAGTRIGAALAGAYAEADLLSLDSDGFTLRWSTNDAVPTQLFFLALGPVPARHGWSVAARCRPARRRLAPKGKLFAQTRAAAAAAASVGIARYRPSGIAMS